MLKFHIIESGYFLADGGAMFGPVPKKYWEKRYPSNKDNMCVMSMRCVFIETEDRKILVDTGLGDKHLSKLKYYRPYNLKNVPEEIELIGYKPEEVTDVILTHLHFDHCGASTMLNEDKVAVPTFPNATYWVSLAQWKNYRTPILFERNSFFADNIEPIFDAGQLRFVTEDIELFDGFRLELYNGHTPGQIVVLFQNGDDKYAYAGDVVPSSLHKSIGWLSAFDNNLAVAMEEKQRFMDKARSENRTLIYFHDAYTPMSKA